MWDDDFPFVNIEMYTKSVLMGGGWWWWWLMKILIYLNDVVMILMWKCFDKMSWDVLMWCVMKIVDAWWVDKNVDKFCDVLWVYKSGHQKIYSYRDVCC